GRVAGVGSAAPAVSLVEQDDPEPVRVEGAALADGAARARAAVHDQGRDAVRVAARLPVDEVAVAGVEHAGLVRVDRRQGHDGDGTAAPRRRAGRLSLAPSPRRVGRPADAPGGRPGIAQAYVLATFAAFIGWVRGRR